MPALDVQVTGALEQAFAVSDLVMTLTAATSPLLHPEDVRPATTIAAVGSDALQKYELDVRLLAKSALVCHVVEQCAAVGELHHALADG